MKIVFMGTPDFAVVALEALCKSEHEVVAVVTQPDQPKGRGYVLTPSPVKLYSQSQGLAVYTPESVKEDAFFEQYRSWNADVCVVAAYGKILPPQILFTPRYGSLNIHSSILPKYRGAAPIQRALMAGEEQVGVTIMQMDEGLDTGDILAVKTMQLTESDNLETVHDRMAQLGAQALLEVLQQIKSGALQPQKQDDFLSTYAAKIQKEDCVLDFSRGARELFWQIRALSPIPLAYTYHNGNLLKIIEAKPVELPTDGITAGTALSLHKGEILVACEKGALSIRKLLPQGKNRMNAADYIRGRKINCGDILGDMQSQ